MTSEVVLDKMKKLMLQFTINYQKLTENDVAELRARLSGVSYIFAEKNIKEAGDDIVKAELAYEREKVEAFKRALKKAEGRSTVAEKFYRGDPKLLEKMEDRLQAKEIYNLYNTLLRQCNQVINSMAAKSRSAYRDD